MSRRITDIPWAASALPSLKPKYPPPPVTSTVWEDEPNWPVLEGPHSMLPQREAAAPLGRHRRAGAAWLTRYGWVWGERLCRGCLLAWRRQREMPWQGSCFTWQREPPPLLMLGPHSSINALDEEGINSSGFEFIFYFFTCSTGGKLFNPEVMDHAKIWIIWLSCITILQLHYTKNNVHRTFFKIWGEYYRKKDCHVIIWFVNQQCYDYFILYLTIFFKHISSFPYYYVALLYLWILQDMIRQR